MYDPRESLPIQSRTFRRPSACWEATAEGVEALKEVSGAVRETLLQLVGGLQSGMGYLGAPSLEALHSQARFARITPAGQRESAPHDIIEIKTAKNS